MKDHALKLAGLILAVALVSHSGCSDSEAPVPAGRLAPPVPAVCEGAFVTTPLGSAALETTDEPAAVALSSCTLDASRNVEIGGANGCGPDVVVDKDFTGGNGLGKITIHSGGKLVFPDLNDAELKTPATISIETGGIAIENGGFFGVGTAACPIGFHEGALATITFTGARAACEPATGCDDGSVKGIEVRSGGILRLYGAKGVPNPHAAAGPPGVSWTALRESAVPAPTPSSATLHLAADVTKGKRPWEDGDWIVVGTSSFSPFESEFVQIMGGPTADGMGGSIVKTAQPLRFAHFGSDAPTPSQQCTVAGKLKAVACGSISGCTAPCTSAPSSLNFNDPAAQNFGIDERAEVGLISRSIKLTASLPAPPPANQEPLDPNPSLHWGGEIRIVGGDAGVPQVAIVGVELEKFGKDQLGSYPIHVHMVGDAKNAPKISANSIHHSFNKCITVHMSSNLTFDDNVCARIVGHMFYEEFGSEENVSFQRNLGLGAMSNSFDIYAITTDGPNPVKMPREDLIHLYWWPGDNLAGAADYNYDGFNIPNTDDQKNPTHGRCQTPDGNGGFGLSLPPYSPPHPEACGAHELYTEPASGFWITNPTTELIGNSIGGCQGVGRAYWWVTPANPIIVNGALEDLKFKPLGIPGHPHSFYDNRGHGCYAGFYGEEEYSVGSTVLVPHVGGVSTGKPLIAEMTGMTATRNRFRGVWLRPTWFVVRDGRFATSRENVSLVTSGGIDGNAPGVWALLKDSVVAGISANNFDRFGPCPTDNQVGLNTGGQFGCIDHTPPLPRVCASGAEPMKRCAAPADCCPNPTDCPAACPATAHSADEVGLGYPPPSWNMFGYMLYDGPVVVDDVRFVNFRKDVTSLLTAADNAFLTRYSASHITPTAKRCVAGANKGRQCNLSSDCPGSTCPTAQFVYEGDAALGWFQSNQSSYPTGTIVRGLSFVNTDLRHQIYTEQVSVNLEFNDGDKNTAVIDEDGSLTGFGVGDPAHDLDSPAGIHPISLNNLPFNATSNSVDECFSRGQQNDAFEGRDSSLISAGSMGTLEFSSLFPFKDTKPEGPVAFPGPDGDVTHTQFITFKRDDPELDANGQPRLDMDNKIIHAEMTLHSRDGRGVWEPKVTSGFGYTASAAPAPNFPNSTGKAGIAHILDVGVADVVKPNITAADPFFVRLGICYTNADGTSHPTDPSKFSITRGYKSYTGGFVDPNDPDLLKAWSPSACNNLDSLHTANITEPTCPGPRPRLVPVPNSGTCPTGSTLGNDNKNCIFPTDTLDRVADPAQMLKQDGTPDLETFTYDPASGMLYLWVAQDEPNPVAPSPLGSCTGDPMTDDPACPDVAHGETFYACPVKGCHVYLIKVDDYSPGPSNCTPYEAQSHAPFKAPNELVLYGSKTRIAREFGIDKAGDPFQTIAGSFCVGGANANQVCSGDGQCPSGKCTAGTDLCPATTAVAVASLTSATARARANTRFAPTGAGSEGSHTGAATGADLEPAASDTGAVASTSEGDIPGEDAAAPAETAATTPAPKATPIAGVVIDDTPTSTPTSTPVARSNP